MRPTHAADPARDDRGPGIICLLCRSDDVYEMGTRSHFRQIDQYQDFLDVPLSRFDRQIVCCRACGFQFIQPMYTSEDLGHLYEGAGYRRFMGVIHPTLTEAQLEQWKREFVDLGVLELVARGRARPRLLDIGCGMGRNMILFDRLGFEVHGLDMNEEETAYVRNALGYTVHNEDLESFARRGDSYDCVLASHFIEHVPDPHRFFETVMGLVSRGGMLLIETPLVSDFSGRHAERYKDIYHTLFFDHFTLALAGAMHGAPLTRSRNVLYFASDSSFNLNIQVRYDLTAGASSPAGPITSGDRTPLRLGRDAYDALMREAIVWARSHQGGIQSSLLGRSVLRTERALKRLSHRAGRLPLRIRRMLRPSGR